AALNAILGRWGRTASATSSPAWNISGEPCTGAAIDSTSFDSTAFNPAVKCDCSYDNATTCHITQLSVVGRPIGRGPSGICFSAVSRRQRRPSTLSRAAMCSPYYRPLSRPRIRRKTTPEEGERGGGE
ncbi:hypothetical protein GW17_00028445, partial [Ensete ventricosum]